MDFNIIAYDKKEILLLEMAKSNREIAQNTKIKQQKTLEFKMNTNSKYFKFDESLILERGEWQMGVISLEVYNSVYNITSKNNTLTFLGGINEEDQKLIEEYIEMMGNEINILRQALLIVMMMIVALAAIVGLIYIIYQI